MASASSLIDGAKTPQHSLDERCKDGFARVIVVIEGIRCKSKLFNSKEASNAEIKLTFGDKHFNLVVRRTNNDGQEEVYQLLAKTPQCIEQDPKSYHKVEKDKISIYLKKVVSKSWLQAGETIDVIEPDEEGEN
ncbi:uncharacterized protein [Ptychodera flava]|uniref:uncharacterized protein n=1 Tax=Ptychodera flava TaxID=63121 RepID=UPI00396A68B5